LEELDATVMSKTLTDVSGDLARLVELRRLVGMVRRGLAPHREVAVALIHPELDALSTEVSGNGSPPSRAALPRHWRPPVTRRS
jgi:hypothetical protein